MLLGARQFFEHVRKSTSLVSCDLSGISCSPISVPINGLLDVSFGGWFFTIGSMLSVPGWREAGGWGGTYMGANGNNVIECRVGTGNSNTKRQWNVVHDIGDWAHWFCVRHSTSMSLFKNGVLVGINSCGGGKLANNSSDFRLTGGFYNIAPFEGTTSVMGFSFFSRAVSQQEIVKMMNDVIVDRSSSPYNDGLVLAVNCNEGQGNEVSDLVSGQKMSLSPTPNWNIIGPK